MHRRSFLAAGAAGLYGLKTVPAPVQADGYTVDVDALRVVSEGVNRFSEAENAGVLLITHYTRILRYIHPQFVHVFVDGRIVESGGPELADELEENGYVRFTRATAST